VKQKLKRFFVSGTNHRCAPLDLREKIAFSRHGIPRALRLLREMGFLEESLILSTCNRVEIYGVFRKAGEGSGRVLEFLRRFHGIDPEPLSEHLYFLDGEEAVRHLFLVASGLDSMVIGENEILGQAKEAFQQASSSGNLASFLHSLFERAFKTAREVKRKTKIGEGSLSVSSVAVEQVRKTLGGFERKNILILGTGEVSGQALRKLVNHKTGKIWIAGRQADRAAELARQCGIAAIPFEDWKKYLTRTDVIFAATAAPHPILHPADISAAMVLRGNKSVFIADLALPRNTDPSVKRMENVLLFDLEDFQRICEKNLRCRSAEIAPAVEIVERQVREFMRRIRRAEIAPLMEKINADCDRMIDRELRKAMRLKPKRETESLKRILTRIKAKILSERMSCFEKAREEGPFSPGRELSDFFDLKKISHQDEKEKDSHRIP